MTATNPDHRQAHCWVNPGRAISSEKDLPLTNSKDALLGEGGTPAH
jgi:hypothetical protein